MALEKAESQGRAGCPVAHGGGAEIADATMADVRVLANPKVFYQFLRKEDPVHFDPKLGAYLVSRYADVQTVMADPLVYSMEKAWVRLFSTELKEILVRDGGGYFPDAIMTDPPYHTRIRRLMEKAFTAQRIKQLEATITARTVDMIERFADRGNVDGMLDLAIPLTIHIMCDQLGMTDVDPLTVQRWSLAFTAQIGRMQTGEQMIENARNICELQHYVMALVRQRQLEPAEDLISDLVHARTDHGDNPALNFEEAVASSRALLIGGNETTSTALGNLLLMLATEPDLAERLYESIDDDRVISRFVEELMRIAPPVRAASRVTTAEVMLGGKRLPAGALIVALFASGNDDDTEFGCPRMFDMSRPNLVKHLSFGTGIHRCVGLSLAKMEIKVVAREVLRRLKNIRLAIPVEDIPYNLTIANHSIESLPLTFARRHAKPAPPPVN